MTTWLDGTTTSRTASQLDVFTGTRAPLNLASITDRLPLVYDAASTTFKAYGTSPQLTPPGVSEMYLPFTPPSTGWATAPVLRPLHLDTIYIGTDASAGTANASQGITSSIAFGDNTHNAKGTLHGFSSRFAVKYSGDSTNEHCCWFGYMRFEDTVVATPGRCWFTDWNVQGALGVQQELLNGISMFINNYYNGSPSRGPSGGVWVSTKEGTGGGATATHLAATTYPTDVGIGIVGTSGVPGVGAGYGFTTALKIGGTGSGWLAASRFGSGIDVADFVDYGIHVSGRKAGSTGPGLRVDSTAVPVLISTRTTVAHAGSMFDVTNESADKDPIAEFGGGSSSSRNAAVHIRNGAGYQKLFVAGTASAFLTGTAQGDTGVLVSAKWHVGGTTKVISVQSTNLLGFFAAAPVGQQTIAAAASDAGTTQTLANSLRTALLNLGLGV
jgi:hypothetical protein